MSVLRGTTDRSSTCGGSEEGEGEKERRWLREELGLRFDPFRHLDAGADPYLPAYLIDHDAFIDLWGDWPSFLFAPAGGGKTAFRVRLARACRVEQDGRRILPVVFYPPRPSPEGTVPEEPAYFEALLQGIGAALLLQLAYMPDRFLELSETLRGRVRTALEHNFPGSLDYYLAQLEDAGSLAPLAQAFDRTAAGAPGGSPLPAEPSAGRIRTLCAGIREAPVGNGLPQAAEERLRWLIELLKDGLGYESIYLLVDGVDAYVQDPSFALRLLQPLLDRLQAWSEQAFFVKFFLPTELRPLLEGKLQNLLTSRPKVTIIKWDERMLVRVIRERLYLASDGMYDSLEAISTRDVGGQIEERLAEIVRPPLPRQILYLTQRVFVEHMKRVGPYGRLESQDFAAAQEWYRGQRGAGS